MEHNTVIGDGDGHTQLGIYHAMECAINNTYSASLNQTLHPKYPAPTPLPCFKFYSTKLSHFTTTPLHLQTTPSPQNLITFPSDRPILHPGDTLIGTQSECERSKLELTYCSVKARFLKRNLNVPYHLSLPAPSCSYCLSRIEVLNYWGKKRLVQRYINRSESTLFYIHPSTFSSTSLYSSPLYSSLVQSLNHTRYNGSISREPAFVRMRLGGC